MDIPDKCVEEHNYLTEQINDYTVLNYIMACFTLLLILIMWILYDYNKTWGGIGIGSIIIIFLCMFISTFVIRSGIPKNRIGKFNGKYKFLSPAD